MTFHPYGFRRQMLLELKITRPCWGCTRGALLLELSLFVFFNTQVQVHFRMLEMEVKNIHLKIQNKMQKEKQIYSVALL